MIGLHPLRILNSAPASVLVCNKVESVLTAIEEKWRQHHAANSGRAANIYSQLARVLAETGVVVDTRDGLEVLEHCRHHRLPIVDLVCALEQRIRAAGYAGGPLSVADYEIGSQPVYVFYDSNRFATFAAVKATVAAESARALKQPFASPPPALPD
jgi:hypothetical protein